MAYRSSMDNLISRLRPLVADPSSADQQFSDDVILEALDRYQLNLRYDRLEPIETREAGTGKRLYKIFISNYSDWESDVTLTDLSYNTLTPATSDFNNGQWTFTNSIPSGVVLATGQVYDIYASAADLCRLLAAKYAGNFDFTSANRSIKSSQKYDHWVQMEQQYRAMAKPTQGYMVRSDVYNCC